MNSSHRQPLALLAGLLLLGSCVGGDAPVGPDVAGLTASLPIQAAIVPSAADAQAQPINRIRAIAQRVPDGMVLDSIVTDVPSSQDSWEISLEVPGSDPTLQVLVLLQLIHVDGSGVETVQYSGRAGPLPIVAGGTTEPASVTVVRGPMDNLSVTSVAVSGAPATLMEGDSAQLSAQVTTRGTAVSPIVYWTSLDASVASVTAGTVHALRPGTARVVASAGTFADTASIDVRARPAAITVTPDTAKVIGVGVDATFSARVQDARGASVPDQGVLWRSLDPGIAQSMGGGVFRSVSAGNGRVEARAVADTTVKGLATLHVQSLTTDLSVAKTASRSTAAEGDTVTFTITLSNVSAMPAAGAGALDSLPAGLSVVSASATSGSVDGSGTTWTVGDMAAGASETLTLRTLVAPGTAGSTLVNVARAIVGAGYQDTISANNRATASVVVPQPTADIAITKQADRTTAVVGDTVVFTINVSNAGPRNASEIQVQDELPPGLALSSAVPHTGTFDSGTGTWTLALDSAGTSTMALRATVQPGTEGTTLANVARVVKLTGATDPRVGDNVATAEVQVLAAGGADVRVKKSVDNPTPAEGDTVTFVIVVANAGPDLATTVVIQDTLPPGIDSVGLQASPNLHPTAFDGVFQIDSLPAGDSAVATLRAVVQPGTAGKTLVNTIRKVSQDQPDPNPANDQASVTVHVAGLPLDIAISKSLSPVSPTEGDTVYFVIEAVNLGSMDATNLVVADSLVAPFYFLSSTPTQGAFAVPAGVWTVGTLVAGDTASMVVSALVVDGSGGTTGSNTASLLSLDQADPNAGNDVATVTAPIQKRRLDIEVVKGVDNPLPLYGSTATFTVLAVNHGPGTATNLTVSDTIPSGLTVSGISPSGGTTYAPATHLWSIPSLATGDTARLVMTTTVATDPGLFLTNRARLTGLSQADTFPANDADSVTIEIPLSTPPVVTILGPADGANFDPGDTIAFSATATDAEDGDLTSVIAWTSDRNGSIGTGGSFSSYTLSPGPHTIAAAVTDGSGTTTADTIHIVLAIVGAPTSLNVPFGGSASLPISLSAPAPAGGLDLTVTSSDPSVAAPTSATLTIPAGSTSANATIQGVLPGSVTLSVTSIGYGSASTDVSVTAGLNILESSLSVAQTFTGTMTVRLESQGTPIAAPAGGLSIDITPTDPSCVAVTSPVTIAAGLVQTTAAVTYGGVAAPPCNTRVKASATDVVPDSIIVYMSVPPGITMVSPGAIGAGLQDQRYSYLEAAAPTATTVHIVSPDSTVLRVSPDATTPGTGAIDMPVSAGQQYMYYYVQGMEGQADTARVTMSVPLYIDGSLGIEVRQPGVILLGVSPTTTTFSAADAFYARVGVVTGNTVSAQAVRAGGTPLTVTIGASDTTVARLVTASDTTDTVTVAIPTGQYNSPTTVASGGVALDPRGAGSVTVVASIPGFVQQPQATQSVTISAPTINVNGGTVGAGLQYQNYAYLGTSAPAATTMHIVSSDSTLMLLSPDATTAGTGSIDVPVSAGQTYVYYYGQGVEGQTGSATATASVPGYQTGSATWTVGQPGVVLVGLSGTTTTFSADDAFYAYIGVVSGNSVSAQPIRAGGTPVTASFSSSDTAVARLVTASDTTDTLSLTIPVGQYRTPTSVASGGVALDPVGAGATTVVASIPGFVQQPAATQTVTVSAPAISVAGGTVGAGLQYQRYAALATGAPAATTAHIVSSDSTLLLVSPNDATPGTGSIDVPVSPGQTYVYYYAQGIEGKAGSATATASVAGYTDGSASWTVAQPGVTLAGLPTALTTFNSDDPFIAYIGIPSGNSVSTQAIRAGGVPVTATFTSSVPAHGQFTTSLGSAGTVALQIPVGQYSTPSSVANGGVAFDPLTEGATTVSVAVPGFIQQALAIQDVTVSSPTITVRNGTVGAGLQNLTYVSLQIASPSATTVHVQSSAPGVLLVSPDANTAGTASIDLPVTAGQQTVYYYTQGVEGQVGTVTVTASAPGYTDGSGPWNVVAPALRITTLSTSATAGGAADAFYVSVGIPSGNGISAQVIRAGGTAATATITSSLATVGTLLTTLGPSASATVQIPVGSSTNATAGGGVANGVSFSPLTAGQTTVAATIPGFTSQPTATVNVVVNP